MVTVSPLATATVMVGSSPPLLTVTVALFPTMTASLRATVVQVLNKTLTAIPMMTKSLTVKGHVAFDSSVSHTQNEHENLPHGHSQVMATIWATVTVRPRLQPRPWSHHTHGYGHSHGHSDLETQGHDG